MSAVASRPAQLVSELVRLSPVELDLGRLVYLAFLCEAVSIARRGHALSGLDFVRTRAGIDSPRLPDALGEACERRALIVAARPDFERGRVTVVRPGFRPPATEWDIRAMAAFVTNRARGMPRSLLRDRVLSSLPVARATPGEPLDLALAGDLHL